MHLIYYSLINRGGTFEIIPCFIIDSLRLHLHTDNPGVGRDTDQFFEVFYVVMGLQSTDLHRHLYTGDMITLLYLKHYENHFQLSNRVLYVFKEKYVFSFHWTLV